MVKRDFKIMCIQILWEKIGKVNFSVFLRILSLPPPPPPKTGFHNLSH